LDAGTVGPDCNNCFGGIFDVTASKLGSGATKGTDNYRITYTVDLTGVDATQLPKLVQYISELALKVVARDASISNIVLENPASGMGKGNVNTCPTSGSGGGWLCLSGITVKPGETLVWAFTADIEQGKLLDVASIQANWDPKNGTNVSEKVAMPEGAPGEIPLLLTSLAAFGIRRKYLSRRQPNR
jgi:hypothetical protein